MSSYCPVPTANCLPESPFPIEIVRTLVNVNNSIQFQERELLNRDDRQLRL